MSIFDRIYGSTSEPDLNTITAADFIKLASEEDEMNLSDLSAAELLLLQEELEAEAYENDVEKVAEALYGSEQWLVAETLGRVQARSMYDEMNKLASADDDVLVLDLHEISAGDLIELEDAGYSLEKVASGGAGIFSKARAWGNKALDLTPSQALSFLRGKKDDALKYIGSTSARDVGRRSRDLVGGRNVRGNIKEIVGRGGAADTITGRAGLRANMLLGRNREELAAKTGLSVDDLKNMTSEQRKVLATRLTLGAGATGAGVMGKREYDKRRGRR